MYISTRGLEGAAFTFGLFPAVVGATAGFIVIALGEVFSFAAVLFTVSFGGADGVEIMRSTLLDLRGLQGVPSRRLVC